MFMHTFPRGTTRLTATTLVVLLASTLFPPTALFAQYIESLPDWGRSAFSPDGKTVLITRGFKTHLLNVADGKELFPVDGRLLGPGFSPDGRYLLTADYQPYRGDAQRDIEAWLWDAATGKKVHQFGGHVRAVRGAIFFPDGRRLLTIGQLRHGIAAPLDVDEEADPLAHRARVWDLETGKLSYSLATNIITDLVPYSGPNSLSQAIALSPDGKTLLAVTGNEIKVFDAVNGRKRSVIATANEDNRPLFLKAMRFSHDGKRVLGMHWDKNRPLSTWDVSTGKLLQTYSSQASYFVQAEFTADDTQIIGVGSNSEILRWEVKTGDSVIRFKVSGVSDAPVHFAVNSRGDRALFAWSTHTTGKGPLALLLNADTGGFVRRDTMPDQASAMSALQSAAFSGDGNHLFMVLAHPSLIDAKTGEILREYPLK